MFWKKLTTNIDVIICTDTGKKYYERRARLFLIFQYIVTKLFSKTKDSQNMRLYLPTRIIQNNTVQLVYKLSLIHI